MNIYITILNEYYELLKISSKTNEGIFFFLHIQAVKALELIEGQCYF